MPIIGLVFIMILFFGGLLFVMYRVLGTHARTATDHLTDLSSEYLKKKDELKKLTEEAQEQARKTLLQTKEEADKLRQESLRDAEDVKARYLDEAHRKGEKIVQDAMQAREALRGEANQMIATKAIERAKNLFQWVLPHELRWAAHVYWLDELMKNGFQQLDGIQSVKDTTEVLITTAFPLTDEQRKLLSARFKDVLGVDVSLKETVDTTIVAGLIVNFGHLVLDGSLVSKLERVVQNVQNKAG